MNKTKITIYLADDDEDDRQFFEDAIGELDDEISLETFNNGIDLLKALFDTAIKNPTLIFLDFNMPLMDGEECLREIRSSGRLKDIPVIIYSTSIDFSKAERFPEASANMYLKKPNNFSALKAAIHDCLVHFEMAAKNP